MKRREGESFADYKKRRTAGEQERKLYRSGKKVLYTLEGLKKLFGE